MLLSRRIDHVLQRSGTSASSSEEAGVGAGQASWRTNANLRRKAPAVASMTARPNPANLVVASHREPIADVAQGADLEVGGEMAIPSLPANTQADPRDEQTLSSRSWRSRLSAVPTCFGWQKKRAGPMAHIHRDVQVRRNPDAHEGVRLRANLVHDTRQQSGSGHTSEIVLAREASRSDKVVAGPRSLRFPTVRRGIVLLSGKTLQVRSSTKQVVYYKCMSQVLLDFAIGRRYLRCKGPLNNQFRHNYDVHKVSNIIKSTPPDDVQGHVTGLNAVALSQQSANGMRLFREALREIRLWTSSPFSTVTSIVVTAVACYAPPTFPRSRSAGSVEAI